MKHIAIVGLVVLGVVAGSTRAPASESAEVLSIRVPSQRYRSFEEFSALRCGQVTWFIRLWTCDASSFQITKVLGNTAPAPYAVKITPKGNNRIETLYPAFRRLYSIHLLAASLEDAVKIRQALIRDVDMQQRNLEKRHRNPPGHMKRVVSSWK